MWMALKWAGKQISPQQDEQIGWKPHTHRQESYSTIQNWTANVHTQWQVFWSGPLKPVCEWNNKNTCACLENKQLVLRSHTKAILSWRGGKHAKFSFKTQQSCELRTTQTSAEGFVHERPPCLSSCTPCIVAKDFKRFGLFPFQALSAFEHPRFHKETSSELCRVRLTVQMSCLCGNLSGISSVSQAKRLDSHCGK